MCRHHPLWSRERVNAVSFRRGDYLGDPLAPLDRSVRDLVEQRTGRRPDGPIALLTQLRTWGWLFNPISLYYCFAPDGETVDDRRRRGHQHPVARADDLRAAGTGTHVVDKQLHVSPFLPMDLHHRFVIGDPGPRLVLGVDDLRAGPCCSPRPWCSSGARSTADRWAGFCGASRS